MFVYFTDITEEGGVGGTWNWMQKWNIAADRAWRLDEKNGIICQVMFTSRVMVIKISKMAHFLYSVLMTAENLWQCGQSI